MICFNDEISAELKKNVERNLLKAKNDSENYSLIYISSKRCVITSPDIPGGEIINGFFTIKDNDKNFSYVIADGKLVDSMYEPSNETQHENATDTNPCSLHPYALMSVDKKNEISIALYNGSDELCGLLQSKRMYYGFSITGVFLTEFALVILGVNSKTHKYETISVYECDNDIQALYSILSSDIVGCERCDYNG